MRPRRLPAKRRSRRMAGPVLLTRGPELAHARDELKATEARCARWRVSTARSSLVDNDSQDGSFRGDARGPVAARGLDRCARGAVRPQWRLRRGQQFSAFARVCRREASGSRLHPQFRRPPRSGCDHRAFAGAGGRSGDRFLRRQLHSWFPRVILAHHRPFRFPSIAGEFGGVRRAGPCSRACLKEQCGAAAPAGPDTAVDLAGGASLMMRRKVLDEIGLFDETFLSLFRGNGPFALRAARAGGPRSMSAKRGHAYRLGLHRDEDMARGRLLGLDSRGLFHKKKNHARYASAATLANVAGGLIWRCGVRSSAASRATSSAFLARPSVSRSAGAAAPGARRAAPPGGPRPAFVSTGRDPMTRFRAGDASSATNPLPCNAARRCWPVATRSGRWSPGPLNSPVGRAGKGLRGGRPARTLARAAGQGAGLAVLSPISTLIPEAVAGPGHRAERSISHDRAAARLLPG